MNKISIVLLILLFIVGCQKMTVRKFFHRSEISGENVLNEVKQREIAFKTFSFKYNAKVKIAKERYNISGHVKIIKDSIIWASVSPLLGIEMARVILKPDSMIFIDRMNATYYEGNYSFLKKLFFIEFDFFTFQSILTNQFFILPIHGKHQRNLLKYKASRENNYFKLQPVNETDSFDKIEYNRILQTMFIHPDLYKIFKISFADSISGDQLNVTFDDYIDTENGKFPQSLLMNFSGTRDSLNIEIKYLKLSVNSEVKVNYKIPEKYKRIY